MSGRIARVLSRSPEQTRAIGARLGAALTGPAAVFVIGGVGCCKTVFVQGLARGLGVPAEVPVTSPSYVLLQDYPGRILLRHVDLYRLETEAEQEAAGLWEALAEPVVAAVEWAERLPPRMRGEGLTVSFAVRGETERLLTWEAAGQAAASLIEALVLDLAGDLGPPPEETAWE